MWEEVDLHCQDHCSSCCPPAVVGSPHPLRLYPQHLLPPLTSSFSCAFAFSSASSPPRAPRCRWTHLLWFGPSAQLHPSRCSHRRHPATSREPHCPRHQLPCSSSSYGSVCASSWSSRRYLAACQMSIRHHTSRCCRYRRRNRPLCSCTRRSESSLCSVRRQPTQRSMHRAGPLPSAASSQVSFERGALRAWRPLSRASY